MGGQGERRRLGYGRSGRETETRVREVRERDGDWGKGGQGERRRLG